MRGHRKPPPRSPAPPPPPPPGFFRGPDGRDYGIVPPKVERPKSCAGHERPLDTAGVCSDCKRYGGPWEQAEDAPRDPRPIEARYP